MRKLVEDVREIVATGNVDRTAILRLEQVLSLAVPRLQVSRLCTEKLSPGRYLCYRDPDFGFVVMVMVWGAGHGSAIHDHGTWGVEAVLKNALRVTNYTGCEVNPQPTGDMVIGPGEIMHNLPPDRDVHKVEHPGAGESAISLHIYGREMSGNRQFVPGEGFKSCKLPCNDLCTELKAMFSLGDLPPPSRHTAARAL